MTDKSQEQQDYEDGQKAGSQANVAERLTFGFVKGYYSDAYVKGWFNGVENQPEPEAWQDSDGESQVEEEEETTGSEEETSSYAPSSSSQSSAEGSTSDPLEAVAAVIGLGFIAFILLSVFSPNSDHSTVSRQSQYEVDKQPAAIPNQYVNPWVNAMKLDVVPVMEGSLSVSWLNQLKFGDKVISPPLLYGDKETPSTVQIGQPSQSGRYAFVTLCGTDWCDDARLVDISRHKMVAVALSKTGATAGVSWYPNETYALVKWQHGGESGFTGLDLYNVVVFSTPDDLQKSLFGEESGNVGPVPEGTYPSNPAVIFDTKTAEWNGEGSVKVWGRVRKMSCKGTGPGSSICDPVETDWALVHFSIPELKPTLLQRRSSAELLGIKVPLDAEPQQKAQQDRVEEPVKTGVMYRVDPDIPGPIPISGPEPQSTLAAREGRAHGDVILYVIVDTEGNPSGLKLLSSIGFGLDEAALYAASKWKFKPRIKDGQPVASATQVMFHFSF